MINIFACYIYLAGYLNVIEDQESRGETDASDCKLTSKLFLVIAKRWPMKIENLNLSQISHKLVTLLELTTLLRVSEIAQSTVNQLISSTIKSSLLL